MESSQEPIRLQKFLADRGYCSRREAEDWIQEGVVLVNGQPAQLGMKVTPGKDRVMARGKLVTAFRPPDVTLAMHKPRGLLCSNEDPHHERTVFDLLPENWRGQRFFCAGRLDKESEGLLILTTDGDLAQNLTHPSRRVVKRYSVLLTRPFDPRHLPLLLRGVEDEGEWIKAEKAIPAKKGEDRERRLEIHLNHGRKREIRRLLEIFGYRVERLVRTQIGGLTLRGIAPGRCRLLNEKDLRALQESAQPTRPRARKPRA